MTDHAKLAKKTIEEFVRTGREIDVPDNISSELKKRAGVFVTLRKNGQLRGCIGTFLPTKKTVAEEIITNAISACSEDLRFDLVLENELKELSFEVSVLGEPREIKNISNHDPKSKGIIVATADGRKGLLLPDIDGVETTEQQISIAVQKGGIDPEQDELQLFEFEVEKFE